MKQILEITNIEGLKEAGNNYAKLSREIDQSEIEMNTKRLIELRVDTI